MTSPSTKTEYTHYGHIVVEDDDGPLKISVENGNDAAKQKIDYSNIKYPMVSGEQYNELPTYPIRPHFEQHHLHMQPGTQVVVYDGCPNDAYHPASMPIYQTATFVQPSATEFGPYDYTRSGNPTRTALETLVAGLENAHSAFAFSSGMAALSAVTRLVQSGEEIIAGNDLYGGMYRLLTKVSARCGILCKFVDTCNLEELEKAITPKTRLIHFESPTNPLMRINDIRKIADIAKKHNVLLSIDSTMMTPILQRPLDLGVDIVVHSGTKFFAGHSDTTLGIVCVKSEKLAKEVAFFQNAEGTGLAPFSCWLTLRGMKTMALRIERAQDNALKVASYLSQQRAVVDLHYAGLDPGDKFPEWRKPDRSLEVTQQQYKLHQAQSNGGGCVLSWTTDSVLYSKKFVNALRLFKVTVSFGSTNSLVELPCLLSHASIPAEERTLPESLIRMSIGIENINDILGDLKHAFSVCEKFFAKN